MTWRRCSEEMPEAGTEVLVWVSGHRGPAWRNNHALVAYLERDGQWWEERHDQRPLIGVYLWQPITPPDEDATASRADNQGATTPDEGTPHGNSDERTA